MIEIAGLALALASILPVALQRVETCVTTSIGLGALCILGIALATGTGHDSRWWLLGAGLVLTSLGGYLQGWHRVVARIGRRTNAAGSNRHRSHGR